MAAKTADNFLPRKAATRLAACRRAVEHALPGVEKPILFHSRARGQAREDSDRDVAVIVARDVAVIVVRDLSDRRRVRRVLSNLAYEHILDGFFIRPIPLASELPGRKVRR